MVGRRGARLRLEEVVVGDVEGHDGEGDPEHAIQGPGQRPATRRGSPTSPRGDPGVLRGGLPRVGGAVRRLDLRSDASGAEGPRRGRRRRSSGAAPGRGGRVAVRRVHERHGVGARAGAGGRRPSRRAARDRRHPARRTAAVPLCARGDRGRQRRVDRAQEPGRAPVRPQLVLHGSARRRAFAENLLLDPTVFAAHGGAFPVIVRGVGVVGTVTVSGLPQEEDHRLVVSVLRDFLGLRGAAGTAGTGP